MALIVSGERIEESVIQQEVERLRPHYEQAFRDKDPQEREAQLLDWSRENVIERTLLSQHAKKYGQQIPKPEVERAFEAIKKQCGGNEQFRREFGTDNEQEVREHIEMHMRVERILDDVCKDLPEPSKEAVLQFYEENKEQFRAPEQVRAAHIVKHINWRTDETTAYDTMIEARNELENGAVFEMLVAKYSDCPDNGGDLGYIARGQMVEEFEDVVFNLAVGQTSDVFRTRFGFHIAKLYDRRPAAIPPLKQVKDRIVSELKEQMRSSVIDEFIDRLRSSAKIEEI
ncbi:MAG TPA: peptidylprolyl isomerase [Sedimentisphaerales bacterium]|nr:peptidylprolyl isomerase [Sedimentisphaerales bacterium]